MGCGDYYGERTYRLECLEAYQNKIQIVTVKYRARQKFSHVRGQIDPEMRSTISEKFLPKNISHFFSKIRFAFILDVCIKSVIENGIRV